MFLRADANADGAIDISDAISLLGCQFLGLPCPPCDAAADANDDGQIDVSDAIFILNCLFVLPCTPAGTRPTCERLPAPGVGLGCREYTACGRG